MVTNTPVSKTAIIGQSLVQAITLAILLMSWLKPVFGLHGRSIMLGKNELSEPTS